MIDNCPNDPNKTEAGLCGCGVTDRDSDLVTPETMISQKVILMR
ncbi:MAG: hypothetical protein AB8G86_01905 [Saprospiraceae bacterium]